MKKPLVDARKGHKKFLKASILNGAGKICNKCKEEKLLSDFPPNKECKLGVTGTCRKCDGTKVKKWYADNRSRRQKIANRNNQRKKRKLVESFGDKCYDCSNTYPDCVYDFHHLDPTKKDVNPSKAMTWSKERMMKELEKCVMLCANCHRLRHYGLQK